MSGARLLALAAERPARIVTNDELSARLDTSDEWIRTRSGIANRRFAADTDTVESLAIGAGAKALAAAGVSPSDVDLVIVATATMPTTVPGAAGVVATGVGAAGAGALDVNAGCAGFCYAVGLAADAVRGGSARHALVIGSERMTDIVDADDRATAVLFGDGAGAAVIGRANVNQIGPTVWGSDGSGADLLRVPAETGHLQMDGRAVYRWATTALAAPALAAIERAELHPRDLRAFVAHQANLRIITALAGAMGLDDTCVIADDVVDSGNTSSASVPMALARLIDEGRVSSGDPVLLFAFGAGLTWAGQVVHVP
ncbi:MAG TPA: beta-ketoacyl-ACP synthase 3 [Mycobacteriales bacterium]|nr:beta-ketoacyl-ACP synthase 3 [Mycobacteriales bacterium]